VCVCVCGVCAVTNLNALSTQVLMWDDFEILQLSSSPDQITWGLLPNTGVRVRTCDPQWHRASLWMHGFRVHCRLRLRFPTIHQIRVWMRVVPGAPGAGPAPGGGGGGDSGSDDGSGGSDGGGDDYHVLSRAAWRGRGSPGARGRPLLVTPGDVFPLLTWVTAFLPETAEQAFEKGAALEILAEIAGGLAAEPTNELVRHMRALHDQLKTSYDGLITILRERDGQIDPDLLDADASPFAPFSWLLNFT